MGCCCCQCNCQCVCCRVFWIGVMLVSCLLKTIGFFSPHWGCMLDKNDTLTDHDRLNTYCELEGLFWPGGIKDDALFYMCLVCFVGCLLLSGFMLIKFYQHYNEDKLELILDDKIERIVSGIFVLFQLLGAAANIVAIYRYEVLGWSAVLFFCVDLLVFLSIYFLIHLTCGTILLIPYKCIKGCMNN